jgi:short-subunit dehydrogenase
MTLYGGTKHAVNGFFDGIRSELALKSSNISITLSTLGSIDTESARDSTSKDMHVSEDKLVFHPASAAAEVRVSRTLTLTRESRY